MRLPRLWSSPPACAAETDGATALVFLLFGFLLSRWARQYQLRTRSVLDRFHRVSECVDACERLREGDRLRLYDELKQLYQAVAP